MFSPGPTPLSTTRRPSIPSCSWPLCARGGALPCSSPATFRTTASTTRSSPGSWTIAARPRSSRTCDNAFESPSGESLPRGVGRIAGRGLDRVGKWILDPGGEAKRRREVRSRAEGPSAPGPVDLAVSPATRQASLVTAPKVLVAYDGSDKAAMALEAMSCFEWPVSTRIRILAVRDAHLRFLRPLVDDMLLSDLEHDVAGYAKRLLARLPTGVAVEQRVLRGPAVPTIITEAAAYEAD